MTYPFHHKLERHTMGTRQVLRKVEDTNNLIRIISLHLLLWHFLQPSVNNKDAGQSSKQSNLCE